MGQRSETKDLSALTVLFFLHGMAMGAWFVPLGPLLDAHGLQAIKPWAFATSAIAALISPLFFGALADRCFAATRVLAGLAVVTALTMSAIVLVLSQAPSPWLVLLLIQLQALCLSPTWGLANAIVFGGLRDARRQFGPIRSVATLGWMAGCWIVSALNADASTTAPVISASVWILLALCTWRIKAQAPAATRATSLRERLGLDALILLRDPQHRTVLLTMTLFAVPLAAFYPFTPTHLRDLGLQHTSAWMSLGQVTEVAALIGLPMVLHRFRFKTVLAWGLLFGLLRYILWAFDTQALLIAGLTLHGLAFTLFFITVQIYVDQRVQPEWRSRAHSLYSLMLSGFGNLVGYLGTGWWFSAAATAAGMNWPLFWGGLAGVIALVIVYFLTAYRSQRVSRAASK